MRNNDFMKYAGMAAQFMATLAVAFFIGIKLDHFWELKFPILTIILPLIMLFVLLWKIVKDSNPTKK
jgi:F0F1-type ATP synthase assembly protein I